MSDSPEQLPAALTALVVDDDPASRLLLSRMLQKRGLSVSACSATEANESRYQQQSLVIARSGALGFDEPGLRALLGRARDGGAEPDSGGAARPLLLAIQDSVEVEELAATSDDWDEVVCGPIDETMLNRCAASIDRWLLEQAPAIAPGAEDENDPEASAGTGTVAELAVAPDNEPESDELADSPALPQLQPQAFAADGLTWTLARSVAERAFFGVVIFDSEEEVIYANEQHVELLDIGVVEAGGISAWLRAGCPDREYAEKVQQAWRNDIWQKQLTRTFTIKSRNERLKDIEFRPRLLGDGSLLLMLCDVTEARRSRDALAIVQAKFRAVFRHLPMGVAMVDRSGRFFDVNPALERLLDCPRIDLLRLSLEECMEQAELRKLIALERAADRFSDEAGPPLADTLRLARRDGVELDVEVSVSAAEEAPASGFLRTYFFREIGAEKLKAERLRASQEQNRALLDAIPDAVLLLNRRGRIEDLVRPSEGLLGGDPAGWLGRELADVLPGFGDSDFLSVSEVIRSGEAREYRFSEAISATDGSSGAGVSSFGRATPSESHFMVRVVRCGADHAVAIVRDVTLAEEGSCALEREALLGEHLQDAIIVCSPRGRIEDWNAAAERVFGYRRHEIRGCGLSKLYVTEAGGTAEFNRRLSQELNEHQRWSAETDFVHKNGQRARCEVLFLPIERDGVPHSLIGIHRPLG